jgi:hypothetical protein
MQQQKGFVLVSVLIITTITTMLAFSQLGENRLQERIAGNQRKELSARLAAEKGIFDAFEYIKEQHADNTSNSDIFDGLSTSSFSDGEKYSLEQLDSIELPDLSVFNFVFVSKGSFKGAVAYLKTAIEVNEDEQKIFDYAVAACDYVSVEGTGNIDSYSSEAYSSATAGSKGDVTVIGGNADLSGNGTVDGSVSASGSVTGQDKVTGSVTENASSAGLGDCDPLNIADQMEKINTQVTDEPDDYVTGAATDFDGINTAGGVSPQTLTVLGEEKQVYVFDNFKTGTAAGKTVEISGDITFYIQGDMTTSNTTFTLKDESSSLTILTEGIVDIGTGSKIFEDEAVNADEESPLTIYSSYISEKTVLENKGKSEEKEVTTNTTAVDIQGNGKIYANVYAPLGEIIYNGEGALFGALWGEKVGISGGGDIHYDEGLADIKSSIIAAEISYSSVYYYYPD